ncbi:Putative ribonuclease H protein At1g65750 [Linum grandiflorum]
MNKALLGKWVWRFGVERSAWWRVLIELKFGSERGSEWRSTCVGISSGWSIWYWIWKESSEFWDLAYVDPGGGEWVRFWHDTWMPGKHLGRDFPRIAACAQSSDSFISDMLLVDDRLGWNLELSHSLRGGALTELCRLKELLNSLPADTISSGPPRLRWSADDVHGFSVKSFVKVLRLGRFGGSETFPASTIWIHSVPTKVCCFTWMASLNSITTIDNLRRRGSILPNRCVLCYHANETVSHILLHCDFSSAVWSFFRQCLGEIGPMPHDVMSCLILWKEGQNSAGFGGFRRVIHQAIWRHLWLERNNRIFRNKQCTVLQLAWKIAINTFRWMQAHKIASATRCSEWLNGIFYPP